MKVRKSTKFGTPMLLMASAIAGFSAQAIAQERAMEEVVVTALKGSTGTALSDTALGITAVDGAYLEESTPLESTIS